MPGAPVPALDLFGQTYQKAKRSQGDHRRKGFGL